MSIFDLIREQIPVSYLVEANCTGKANCTSPDHPDDEPSMHLYDDHVHCYSCGFHGDAVDVWAVQRNFDRPIGAAVDLAREFGVELPDIDQAICQKA